MEKELLIRIEKLLRCIELFVQMYSLNSFYVDVDVICFTYDFYVDLFHNTLLMLAPTKNFEISTSSVTGKRSASELRKQDDRLRPTLTLQFLSRIEICFALIYLSSGKCSSILY